MKFQYNSNMNKKELFLYSSLPKTKDQLQIVFDVVGLNNVKIIHTDKTEHLHNPDKLKLVFPCDNDMCFLCKQNIKNLFIINHENQPKICPLNKNIFKGSTGLKEFIKILKTII
jgi:aspartate carbamoyltransferase regulatory subunit